MITEDYVSFETAKLLKEKGFDCVCQVWYSEYTSQFGCEKYSIIQFDDCNRFDENHEFICYAPTLQLACKWLREVHHWHIFVIPKWEDVEYMPGEWEEKMVGYQYVIINVGEVNRKNEQPTTTALSPESACESAIKYCLENLI